MAASRSAVGGLLCFVGLAVYALLDFPGLEGLQRVASAQDQPQAPARFLRASQGADDLQSKLLSRGVVVFLQLIFAAIYYFKVVKEYPSFGGEPTAGSTQLQRESALMTIGQTSTSNCVLSACCAPARAAHTMDKVGILDYMMGVFAMLFCPLCTLCYANACTELNEKLGGEKQNIVMSCLCTWCCACCTIAQDAQSLDEATGAKTHFFSVEAPPQMSSMEQGIPEGIPQGYYNNQQ